MIANILYSEMVIVLGIIIFVVALSVLFLTLDLLLYA